jgi:hypothetical protein
MALSAISCLLSLLIVRRMGYFNDEVFCASVWIAILLCAYVLVYFLI